jgi:hypothetical protein
MGLCQSQITLVIVDIVLVSTAKDLCELQKQFEILELGLFKNSNHITKFDCRRLEITDHHLEHIQNLKERSFLSFYLVLPLVQKIKIERQ